MLTVVKVLVNLGNTLLLGAEILSRRPQLIIVAHRQVANAAGASHKTLAGGSTESPKSREPRQYHTALETLSTTPG